MEHATRRPTNLHSPNATLLTQEERERIRRQQEEFWTGLAGFVVAGAAVIGFATLVAKAFR